MEQIYTFINPDASFTDNPIFDALHRYRNEDSCAFSNASDVRLVLPSNSIHFETLGKDNEYYSEINDLGRNLTVFVLGTKFG